MRVPPPPPPPRPGFPQLAPAYSSRLSFVSGAARTVLTAQGCSERSKAKHKKTPPHPFVSRRLRAQLVFYTAAFRAPRQINRLLSVSSFLSYSELFGVL